MGRSMWASRANIERIQLGMGTNNRNAVMVLLKASDYLSRIYFDNSCGRVCGGVGGPAELM